MLIEDYSCLTFSDTTKIMEQVIIKANKKELIMFAQSFLNEALNRP